MSLIERKKGEKLVFIPTRWFRLKITKSSSENNFCTFWNMHTFRYILFCLHTLLFQNDMQHTCTRIKMCSIYLWQNLCDRSCDRDSNLSQKCSFKNLRNCQFRASDWPNWKFPPFIVKIHCSKIWKFFFSSVRLPVQTGTNWFQKNNLKKP